jgi:uncharacterized repeat protein (TIGR03803 family)
MTGTKDVLSLAIALALAALASSSQAQTLITLHAFTGGADGASPQAGLIQDKAGNLYGTTAYGGVFNVGTVFKLDKSANESVLYTFTGGADGAYPFGPLVQDAAGNLYGTTLSGGDLTCGHSAGCGTVFKLDATGKQTVLHTFTGGTDGVDPYGNLFRDVSGNFYGITLIGGNHNCNTPLGCGVVFKLDANGNETVLHTFSGGADGAGPSSGVIRDAAGNLFGTTQNGGPSNSGTVFQVDRTGKATVLYSFTGGTDGASPEVGVVPFGAYLYGTTSGGGVSAGGTVFKLDKSGKETVLYSFTGGTDGGAPRASLIHDAAGNLYGTTEIGGIFNHGTVFKLDTNNKLTVLYSFEGGTDGGYPVAPLVRDAAGNLYGTVPSAGDHGASGVGTVFKITP